MQRLLREGSVMKKAGFENMNMGELKRSTKLKEELYLKMRDANSTQKIVAFVYLSIFISDFFLWYEIAIRTNRKDAT